MAKDSIGGLWVKKDRNDNDYFQGSIDWNGGKIRITIFANKYKKEGDKQPDYKIYLSEYKGVPSPLDKPEPQQEF